MVFLAVCGVVVAALPLWSKVKRIDEQTTNKHDENMRDEITRGFREIRGDIRGLHEEISTERRERIEGDKRRSLPKITELREDHW